MSYVEENLLRGETVEYTAKIHWIGYFVAIVWAILGIIAFSIHWMVAVAILIASALKIFAVFARELAVTNKRIVGKTGLVRRDTIELKHDKIETIRVDQSIFGRLLGYGTVTVRGTGSSIFGMVEIEDPFEFRREAATVGERQKENATGLAPSLAE